MVLRLVGFVLSYILYYIGHILSIPMNWTGLAWIYPIYNRLMLWSYDIQEATECNGPWTLTRGKK